MEREHGFRSLAAQTVVAYVRMASTVVIAVVVRLCLDCVGIILTEQDPTEATFWFAHCQKDGTCVLAGIVLFFASLVGCSVFAWSCQDWITDPARNPYANRFSFAIIMEAASWIPISVIVGKTNALVEWFVDISQDDRVQPLLSSTLAVLLTISCALFAHFAMKHCHSVAGTASKEAGWAGFGKTVLLVSLQCFGWAVGWSNWELVMSLMDALEPGRSMHNPLIVMAVIPTFLLLSTCFYLRYGPEPIIPDPTLQNLCYNHGYSSSVRRSLVSYVVYSCVVFIVMCCCDPSYGILIVIAREAYGSISSTSDPKALVVLCAVACAVTVVAALCSALLTWATKVDALTSMKLSRSVHDACQRMVCHKRTSFSARLTQVLGDGSDVRFLEGEARELGDYGFQSGGTLTRNISDLSDEEDALDGGGAAIVAAEPPEMRSPYTLFGSDGDEDFSDIESERRLRLNPGKISRTICMSVLIYDVLGFVVCFQWGMIALRVYTVVFGHVAGLHNVLYVLSCLLYAAGVVLSLSRFVFSFFPSTEELKCRAPDVCRASPAPSELPDGPPAAAEGHPRTLRLRINELMLAAQRPCLLLRKAVFAG